MTEQTPTPAVDQIWQDNDKRSYGRRVRIVEISDTHAVVEQVVGRDHALAQPGRQTRIRLDRFRPISTGYRYIGDGA